MTPTVTLHVPRTFDARTPNVLSICTRSPRPDPTLTDPTRTGPTSLRGCTKTPRCTSVAPPVDNPPRTPLKRYTTELLRS